ncbi:hypothetical protein LLS47_17370 [Rouxiella badensis]|uniref:hypothetical protein n=1 Tax=Rouxiella badensis TaxID=1646377 RepID=UPI001D1456B7|nr:hypothetical protein [Rouxiella badensis]MCC3734706.1 hypothetical protein [Rouxiella badensis]MCC3760489.1 hypothetical protein [Rouxiella badensis]
MGLTLASTAAALGIIDKAVSITKKLSDDSGELDKATLKLELANLMGELASVKLEVVTFQALLFEAEEKHKHLEEQLKDKQTFNFHYGVFWKEGDEIAFCPRCYEGESKKVHMRKEFTGGEPEYGIRPRNYWYCFHCNLEATIEK